MRQKEEERKILLHSIQGTDSSSVLLSIYKPAIPSSAVLPKHCINIILIFPTEFILRQLGQCYTKLSIKILFENFY